MPLGLSENELMMGWRSSLHFLYIIYLNLGSSLGFFHDDKGPHQTAIFTEWCSLFCWAKFGLICWVCLFFCLFEVVTTGAKESLLWKCSVLIKGRAVKHPFWAGLILVNCLSIPFLSQVIMIHKGVFVLQCAFGFACFLPTGFLETMTNDGFVKLLCRSHVFKCLTHGNLIAIFLVVPHLWSAVPGEEQT